jgi:hypothetical protein
LRHYVAYHNACPSNCPPLTDLYYDSPTEVYQQGGNYLDYVEISPSYYGTMSALTTRVQTIINNTGGKPVLVHNYVYALPTACRRNWGVVINNTQCLDTNNNVQVNLGGSGTTGATAPTWNASQGGTTVDGGVTWTNEGMGCDQVNTAAVCKTSESAAGAAEQAEDSGVLRFQNTLGKYAVIGFGHWMVGDWNNGSSSGLYSLHDDTYDGSMFSTLSTCTGSWASGSHTTPQCITDANGNFEFLMVAGEAGQSCSSGGTTPAWPSFIAANYGKITTDGTCLWNDGYNYALTAESWNAGNYLGPLYSFFTSNLCDPIAAGTSGAATRGFW